jgi:hypothetical protein
MMLVLLATAAASSGQSMSSQWPTNGYDTLPTLWFGANESGPNDQQTLELIGRHSLAIISWGQAIKPHGSRDAEQSEAEAAMQARGYLDSVGNNNTVIGVYRQIQIALGLFNISHSASLDPANAHFWLHQVDNASNICGMTPSMGDKPSPWGTWDPYWNFTNQGKEISLAPFPEPSHLVAFAKGRAIFGSTSLFSRCVTNTLGQRACTWTR